MSTIKVDNLQTTGGAGLYPAGLGSTLRQLHVSILKWKCSSMTDYWERYYR